MIVVSGPECAESPKTIPMKSFDALGPHVQCFATIFQLVATYCFHLFQIVTMASC